MLAQILWHGFTIGEVSCPTKYFKEASSINFRRSVKYGFGCLNVGLKFRLAWHWNIVAGDPYYALDCREDDYAWANSTRYHPRFPGRWFRDEFSGGH